MVQPELFELGPLSRHPYTPCSGREGDPNARRSIPGSLPSSREERPSQPICYGVAISA